MLSLGSSDSASAIVVDASGVINLNASRRARQIIEAFPQQFVVTENVCVEIEDGLAHGHDDWPQLQRLLDLGLIRRVSLNDAGLLLYEKLTSGVTAATLDDGEAATIGYAVQAGAVSVIDERKARRVCQAMSPMPQLISSVEVLLHANVMNALGRDIQAKLVIDALMGARMRVPHELYGTVLALVGEDNAAICNSLPQSMRK